MLALRLKLLKINDTNPILELTASPTLRQHKLHNIHSHVRDGGPPISDFRWRFTLTGERGYRTPQWMMRSAIISIDNLISHSQVQNSRETLS